MIEGSECHIPRYVVVKSYTSMGKPFSRQWAQMAKGEGQYALLDDDEKQVLLLSSLPTAKLLCTTKGGLEKVEDFPHIKNLPKTPDQASIIHARKRKTTPVDLFARVERGEVEDRTAKEKEKEAKKLKCRPAVTSPSSTSQPSNGVKPSPKLSHLVIERPAYLAPPTSLLTVKSAKLAPGASKPRHSAYDAEDLKLQELYPAGGCSTHLSIACFIDGNGLHFDMGSRLRCKVWAKAIIEGNASLKQPPPGNWFTVTYVIGSKKDADNHSRGKGELASTDPHPLELLHKAPATTTPAAASPLSAYKIPTYSLPPSSSSALSLPPFITPAQLPHPSTTASTSASATPTIPANNPTSNGGPLPSAKALAFCQQYGLLEHSVKVLDAGGYDLDEDGAVVWQDLERAGGMATWLEDGGKCGQYVTMERKLNKKEGGKK
ncbi:hypothetical protein JCM5296_001283 [Sporobolomyces johnsonii]